MNHLLRQICVLFLMAGLLAGQQTVNYRLALPGYVYSFPRDHGSHPDFKLEWWYYTGHVHSNDGRDFGYELTFFRTGMDRLYENPSSWRVRDLYMAHFAVTDITGKKFYYFEKLNRAGPGIAGAATGSLHVWNENWSAESQGQAMKLTANAGAVAIELTLESKKAPAVHGIGGISQKAEGIGHSSHYYSTTRLASTGEIRVGTQTFQVQGESWMDHEFGTNELTENQAGWDWFSIQLDDASEVMIYRLRNRDGSLDGHSSGTIVGVNSQTEHLAIEQFIATPLRYWRSGKTGTSYPIEWTIQLPKQACAFRMIPLLDDQELVTTRSTGIAYWEGAVRVTGTCSGKTVTGRGYVELTGYLERYRPKV